VCVYVYMCIYRITSNIVTTEELLERKSSGSGLENRKINGRRDPLR
jgi:hypothetical protein